MSGEQRWRAGAAAIEGKALPASFCATRCHSPAVRFFQKRRASIADAEKINLRMFLSAQGRPVGSRRYSHRINRWQRVFRPRLLCAQDLPGICARDPRTRENEKDNVENEPDDGHLRLTRSSIDRRLRAARESLRLDELARFENRTSCQ